MAGSRPQPYLGLRFWVIGNSQVDELDVPLSQRVDEAQQADVALVLRSGIEEARSYWDNPDLCLMPLLDFSGRSELFPEALWHGDSLSQQSLEDAAAVAAPVVDRLWELPDLRRLADTCALTMLAWAYSRQAEIRARWEPNRPEAVSYPPFRSMAPARERLEELAGLGLLERNPFDQLHYCQQCGSSRLNVREECAECRSGHLSDTTLVHHYRCAFQAPEEAFVRGRELQCPKCHRQLRHYGVDYDKPGRVCVCRSCGEQNSDPVVGFVCMDCGEHADGERMPSRRWYHYSLTPDGVAAARSGSLPRVSLEQEVATRPGGYSLHDFIVLLRFQLAQARRYDRPLIAMALQLENAEELARTAGRQDVAQALHLLVENLSSALRQSDALTARGQTLYVLLPETEPKYTQLLADRLQQRAHETLAVQPRVGIVHFQDPDSIEELLVSLGGGDGDAISD